MTAIESNKAEAAAENPTSTAPPAVAAVEAVAQEEETNQSKNLFSGQVKAKTIPNPGTVINPKISGRTLGPAGPVR